MLGTRLEQLRVNLLTGFEEVKLNRSLEQVIIPRVRNDRANSVSYCSLTTLTTSVGLQKQRVLCVIWIIQLFKVKQLYLIVSPLQVFPAVVMKNFRCHSVKRLCFTLNDLRVSCCQEEVVKLSYPLTGLLSCGSSECMHRC